MRAQPDERTGCALEPRFAPPFRWEVALAAGTNVLEVTVANTLANALVPELGRIGRDFPPESSWSFREEAFYAKDGFASGLIGPVTLGFPVEDSKLADRQWQCFPCGISMTLAF